MRRAVAFWSTIAESERFADQFELVAGHYQAEDGQSEVRGQPLTVPTRHVDGTKRIRERRADIRWLQQEPADDECRALTNAKCLTEGVDVPALDAVMFLGPRCSTIDIVQAVGRVMRKPPGKEIGYIILPVVVPAGQSPEQALDSNPDYEVVWSVLQALRSHDERFNSYVNRIQYLSDPPQDDPENPIEIIDVSSSADEIEADDEDPAEPQLPGMFAWGEEWTGAIYSRLVKKVGTRTYWEESTASGQTRTTPAPRKVEDPTVILFNDLITIADIPERAHDYRLGARSAIDWVVDQQRVKIDKKSGITNDPNDWATEHGDPRYILDLVGRVVTVSMRTLDIIAGLPKLDLDG